MLNGIDFSFGSGLTTDQIKAGGKSFVCRYLSGGGSKDISAAELANYKAAGIAVVFVWETWGTMPSQAQGVADAHAAQAELNRLASAIGDSSVAQAPVFFAADAAQMADEPGYLAGVASVLGKARTGVYGGLGSVQSAFNGGLVAYGWQTYAWSGSPTQWDDRALLRQVLNGVHFGPATVDLDEAAFWNSTDVLTLADDFGQWPKPSKTPSPPPSSGPYEHIVPAGNAMTLDGIARDRGTTVANLASLTQQHADAGNVAILNAYLALDGALAAMGKPRPAMPEGFVYYTENP